MGLHRCVTRAHFRSVLHACIGKIALSRRLKTRKKKQDAPCQRRFEGATLLALLRATFALAIAFRFGLGIGNGSLALAAPRRAQLCRTRSRGAKATRATTTTRATATTRRPRRRGDASDEDEGGSDADSALHALTCLDGDGDGRRRRKGVQRRDFLKRHRFELSGVGGFYASDALSSTYSYGGALAYYPSEDFGLEVLVTRSPVQLPPRRAVHVIRSGAPLRARASPGRGSRRCSGRRSTPS